MARRSNETATFFAQKKLLGKAHTSNLLTDAGETIGTNVQLSSTTVFGEPIPTNPTRTLNVGQGVGAGVKTVEYVEFALEALTDSFYDANDSGGGSGSESGESSQTAGHHAYAFKFKSTYESDTDDARNRAGNGNFDNNKKLYETLGAAQLVPFNFSGEVSNPYVVKLYKDNGSGAAGDEIVLLANIDWQVDTYNGILFVQDFSSTQVPAFARAFVYIGDMLDVVAASGGGGSGPGESAASYLVLSSTGSLTNERVLTAGTGIVSTDAGANGNFTLDIDDSVVATLSGSQFSGNVGVTGSFGATLGLSGSLTQLTDGSSYLVAGSGTTITSASNGQVTISSSNTNGNYVFNEYLGQADGTNTFFTLSNTPTQDKNISIFVNGLLQMPSTLITSAPFQDYSVTGSNIYFMSSSIPPEGSLLMANYTTNEAI